MSSSSVPKCVPNEGVVEIQDPDIDVPGLMERIRVNMATRQQLPPLAAVRDSTRYLERRARLLWHLHELNGEMRRFGTLPINNPGLLGKVELFFKKVVRKFIKRHIAQQQDVNARALEAFHEIVHYLDFHEQLVRERLAARERQFHETLERLRAEGLRREREDGPYKPLAA